MTVVQELSISEAERSDVAARVAQFGKEAEALIRNHDSDVKKLSTAFFTNGAVYRVIHNAAHRPIVFTVGTAGKDYAVMLPMNLSGFFDLASKAGLILASPELRVGYAEVFLESTRDFRKRFLIIKNASDIKLLPNPSADQQTRHSALMSKYGSVIRAPMISPLSPSEVILYALSCESLLEIRLKIAPDGKIARTDSTLEKDLPIGTAR
jgi:hypothetical protein